MYDEFLSEEMHSISFALLVITVIFNTGLSANDKCENILKGFLVGQEVTSIGYKNLESMKKNLKIAMNEIRTELKVAIKKSEDGMRSAFSSLVKARARNNIIYTRWGRKDCPDHADSVYTGYVGGSYYGHSGGAADPLCLPSENPKFIESRTTFYAFIYGAEYEVNEIKDDRASLHDHKVPCAVCTRRGKSAVKMFPAMDDCPGNFSQEYNGTLMAGAYNYPSATQYTCIDKHPEALTGAGHINQNGRLFHTVSAACGSLKCPPYKNNKELACVVCSL